VYDRLCIDKALAIFTLFSIDRFLCLFISLCISLSAGLRENGWTDLHEIFREGVKWPRDYLIKFRVNSGKWVGGSKVNLLSPDIAIWFDFCLLAVLCCHLATENVMKSLFLALFYMQHGGGVCCASYHSLLDICKVVTRRRRRRTTFVCSRLVCSLSTFSALEVLHIMC